MNPLSPLTVPDSGSANLPTSHAQASSRTQAFIDSLARGRPRQRQVVQSPIDLPSAHPGENENEDGDEDGEYDADAYARMTQSEIIAPRERKSSMASRRSATLVFMGVWALFGVGSVSKRGAMGIRRQRASEISESAGASVGTGKVLWHSASSTAPSTTVESPVTSSEAFFDPLASSQFIVVESEVPLISTTATDEASDRFWGRISAWTCTTLYLTSRLPQIWKNVGYSHNYHLKLFYSPDSFSLSQFMRKSVEGLSILLFIFAFLGNTFYVLSILASPNMDLPAPQARAFLMESVP